MINIPIIGYLIKYRISAIMKIETDIMASVAKSRKGQALILVIMSVTTFNTDVIR